MYTCTCSICTVYMYLDVTLGVDKNVTWLEGERDRERGRGRKRRERKRREGKRERGKVHVAYHNVHTKGTCTCTYNIHDSQCQKKEGANPDIQCKYTLTDLHKSGCGLYSYMYMYVQS